MPTNPETISDRSQLHFLPTNIRLDAVLGNGDFKGYASVKNKLVPAYNEKVVDGAFKRTLDHNKGRVAIFNLHDPWSWIGMGRDGIEDNHGLFVHGGMNVSDRPSLANDIHGLLLMCHELKRDAGISIGFSVLQEEEDAEGIRLIKELKLWEYSICPPDWQANEPSTVTDVRSFNMRNEIRTVLHGLLTELGVKLPDPMDITQRSESINWNDPANRHSLQLLSEAAERVRRAMSPTR